MSGEATKMSDVALHAGVSTATVSRVLGGKPGVRQSTRDAVFNSMEELGYSRERTSPARPGLVIESFTGLLIDFITIVTNSFFF